MDRPKRIAKAIKKKPTYNGFVYGVWQGAETEDANLSKVLVVGSGLDGSDAVLRYIPKAEHVTGLTTSSTVLCVGNPLCIIAVVQGDITLAAI